jgi:exonuclease III
MHKHKFTIVFINLYSLRYKFHQIEFILNEELVDILVINETKLTRNDDSVHFKKNARK